MTTRKNPARLGTKASTTQSHPTNHLDDSSEPPASGDAVAPSPTARLRRGEPRTARMYQGQNGAPPGQHTQHLDLGIYDENGMQIPDRDSSHASRGGEGDDSDWLFKELITPNKDQTPPGAHHTMRNGLLQEEIIKEGRKPVPTTSLPALYQVGIAHLGDNALPVGEPYSMDTDPIARTPPDYHYQLTPPTNPLYLSSQFNPLELAQEARNPNGTGSIVQSTEHAYALMHMAQAHTHIPLRRATVGSVYVNEEGGYPTYSDGRPQGVVRQQQTSPTSWQQRTSSSPGVAWSTQPSPTAIPRGWQQASPRNQGQDQSGTQQQHVQSTPPGVYRNQASWAQVQDQSNADRRPTPPSPSGTTFWRSGIAPGPGPSPQSAATHGIARPREVSWPQGDLNRPPSHPSSTSAPVPRWAGPGPSPVTTANPASWAAPHSMGNAPSNNAGAWQTQGAPPRSAGPLQHQPHPTIDGPSDDGMRWSAPTSTTESNMGRAWQGSSDGSTMGSSAGDGAGSVVGSAPGTRYVVDESGRPTQVRTHGANHVRMGSNQMSSMTWTHVQGNPRAPWAQMSNTSGTLPLDGRIQTPGGTGAMGGHAPAARPPTATTQMTGQYPASATQGYQTFVTRSGSVQGQPRPGEYPPAVGNEIPYGSQPDSMVAYGTNSRPGGGMPPPSSVASGPPQGYTVASGPPPTGNPYPPVPPATGAPPYGISRPGMLSQQQQQHHQQPPPNAHGNMYPNYNLHQQPPPTQPQGPGLNGPVYAPYTNTGPPPSLTYPMNPGPPMQRMVQRMGPGSGPMQMTAYSAIGAPQNQPQQDAYNRMGPGTTGTGRMEGYRPQQPH